MASLSIFFMIPIQGFALTSDPLYSQINSNGVSVDGNPDPVVLDKPIIRPTYLGSNPYDDYIGPYGQKFKINPYDPTSNISGNLMWTYGDIAILQQMGFYKGRPLALLLQSNGYGYLAIKTNGGTAISDPTMPYGFNVRLVYNDGQIEDSSAAIYTMWDSRKPNKKKIQDYESVKDVFLELPMVAETTADGPTFESFFVTRTKGLQRLLLNSDYDYWGTSKAANVSHSSYNFWKMGGTDTDVEPADALKLKYNNYNNLKKEEYITIYQDSNTVLTVVNRTGLNYGPITDLFAEYIPPYRDLTYGPPKSLGASNTDKLEAIYSITQGVGIGYAQFYPDSLSIVMDDTERKIFKKIDFNSITFTDEAGNNISSYLEMTKVTDHQVEFKILKDKLILLKNNQIRIKMNANGINPEELVKYYNPSKQVYEVPMEFYNYKVKDNQKTASDKLTAIAEIIPNLYGEAVEGTEVSQYTRSSDLDANQLVKNVATTLPNSDKVTVAFKEADQDIYFDTVKPYSLTVVIHSVNTGREKLVTVPIKVNQAIPVTSEFFENQAWLINEINRQLAPKKIDGNPTDPPNTVYMNDLEKIKSIVLEDISGDQKIPLTIPALTNLEELNLSNSPGLKGSIPKEIGKLSKLAQLKLTQTGISGTIPNEITQLAALTEFDVSGSNLVGNLPDFSKDQLAVLNVSDTQLTYNLKDLPPFIKAEQAQTTNSFIYNPGATYLQLVAPEVKIYDDKQTEIQPFDTANRSSFELGAQSYKNSAPINETEPPKQLLEGHLFTIKNAETNELYYEGQADPGISIPYSKGIAYKVTMDQAEQNSNNTVLITTKLQKQKVNVTFIDETGAELHTPAVTLEGIIGETIDLTKNDDVQQIINDLIAKHYQIKQKPASETAVKIQEKESTVTYQFEGTLFVYSHPKFLSFGTKMLLKGLRFIKVEKARFDQPLVIWDNRKKSNSWKVTATLEKSLTSVTDPSKSLPNAIRYKRDETDIVTFSEGNSEVLAEKTSNGSNEYNLSDDWKTGNSGFQLEVPTGKVVQPGGYAATILWQVGDTP